MQILRSAQDDTNPLTARLLLQHLHRHAHQSLQLLIRRLRQESLGPHVVLARRITIQEPTNIRDEGDALDLGSTLHLGCALLGSHQRLEPVRVAEGLRRERRNHLTEMNVGVGEGLGVPLRTKEDRPDHRALPLNRHDDDGAHVPRVERRLHRPEHRIRRGVGDEHRLLRLERPLQLRIAIQVDDQIADRGILVAGDESDLVLLAGEEDGAAVQAERVAELPRDALQDVDEMQRRRNLLENVDDGDEMIALLLQLGDAAPQPRQLVVTPEALRSRRRWCRRARRPRRAAALARRARTAWIRRLGRVALIHVPRCAR